MQLLVYVYLYKKIVEIIMNSIVLRSFWEEPHVFPRIKNFIRNKVEKTGKTQQDFINLYTFKFT